jgi:hypothetical protein
MRSTKTAQKEVEERFLDMTPTESWEEYYIRKRDDLSKDDKDFLENAIRDWKTRKTFNEIIDVIGENLKPDQTIQINGDAVTAGLMNVIEHHFSYMLNCLPFEHRFDGIKALEDEFSLIIERASFKCGENGHLEK